MQKDSCVQLTPSPPLPRKRGRVQTECAARADEHANEGAPMALMRIIAAVAALLAAAAPAPAQDWPTRPVTIIVPFAAGGAFDVMARVFSPTSPRFWVSR